MSLKQTILAHWPKFLAVLAAIALIGWAYGCQPTTASLLNDGRKVTRAELQLELETLQKRFEIRSATLEQKEQLRHMILNAALQMAQTGQVNPMGLLINVAALYGVGSGVNTAKNKIKTRVAKARTPTPTT